MLGSFVLALAGRPEHGWTARLKEQSKALRFSAQVHTAAALMLGGDPRQATAEGGRELLAAATERIGGYLKKLSTSKRHAGFPFAES